MTGILGTQASLASDISLILEIVTTLLFSIGYFYERKTGKHCTTMLIAVTTNIAFILSYMVGRLLKEEAQSPPSQYTNLYRILVIPHGILSVLVIILAISQAFLAYKWRKKTKNLVALGNRKNTHRKIGLTTLVVWYISFLSGASIYMILYVL